MVFVNQSIIKGPPGIRTEIGAKTTEAAVTEYSWQQLRRGYN
jgi:hypothetical protein